MAINAPTQTQIRTAHRQAVGGGRKRCRKGKNCSAACIQAGMVCLVELPESAGVATTKVRNMLMQRMGGKMPAPAAPTAASLRPSPEAQSLKSGAKGVLRELKPEKAPSGPLMQKPVPVAAPKIPAKTPPAPQPSAPTGEGQSWRGKFGGRTPALDAELNALSAKINKLSPEQQAYWNDQVNKQMNPKLASRNGTPYSADKTNKSLLSQAKAWNYLVENGQPKELMNRIGEKRPAPKGMVPDVTSSGQRKWISPDDGLKYSLNKGNWRQNRVSKADTDRRLPDITSFRREQKAAGAEWPAQKLPAREGLPKSVNEIIKGLSSAEKNAIVFNGLDATGNEGVKLRAYYNANPAEKEARLREIIQRWHDQGGRSGVSGKPVAIPGLEPKKGEERSSVDHFQPISTSRAKELPASEMRKIADNHKNFLIAEEGPNSQRGARTWDSWLDKREGEGQGKGAKAAKAEPKVKLSDLSERNQERAESHVRMFDRRVEKAENPYPPGVKGSDVALEFWKEEMAPFRKFSEDEKAALGFYGENVQKHYADMNSWLRSGQKSSDPGVQTTSEFMNQHLRTGLEKLNVENKNLERAVSGDFAGRLATLRPGDVIEDKGYGSYTNKGAPTLNQFIQKEGDNAIIRVLNATGRDVSNVMEYSSEGEHLTMPGSKYRLKEVQDQGFYSRKTNGSVPVYVFEEVQ